METWSPYVYDNDDALNFMWDTVCGAFQRAETNEEFLVVADLFIKYGAVDYVGNIIEKLTAVIQEELSDNVLNKWNKDWKESRRKLLSDMLQKIEKLKQDVQKELKTRKKL
jgi:hypothetical protein